jgi:phosphotransacetylase
MSADATQTQSPSKYDRLIAAARAVPPVPTVVVHPCDETSLRGAIESAQAGIIRPILVGPERKIMDTAAKHGLDIAGFEIVDAAHSEEAAAKGVELIHAAKGEMLMKGSLHTDELMRAVTAKVGGLRTDRRISHVFVMDVPTYADTLFVTDAAINIFPDLDAKRDIIQNAIDLYNQAGFGKTPRVAILSAVETVTSKFRRRSRRRHCARWRIAVRSPADCSTDRLRSTTPSMSRRHASRASSPRLPAGHRSWSFPTWRPATCSRRISPTSPRPMVPASCSAPGCRSS